MEEWLKKCESLIQYQSVWEILADTWPWKDGYDSGFTPEVAVHCALLDVLAPTIGENYTPHN